jgi:hypothetical protein
MMGRILAQIALVLLIAMGPVHAGEKGMPSRPPDSAPPDPPAQDQEIIAVMDILKLMDLAKEMEMVKDMDQLVEENQNEPTTD